jgi:hypothetical protein
MANHTRFLILLMAGLFSLAGCSTQPKTQSGGPSSAGSVSASALDNTSGKPHDVLYLRRVMEPREHAFSLLIPKGWRTEGGILRINPMTMNGAVNTLGAKVDFQVKRDERGTVLMHWIPEMTYEDPRYLPAQAHFPVGSMYMGMKVYPIMPAFTFLQQAVFPAQHPQARNMKVLGQRPQPHLAQAFQQKAPCRPGMGCYTFDAGLLTVTYDEGGVHYKEMLLTAIEDSGALGVGMWTNKSTMLVRAPAAEFDKLAPLFALIQSSEKLNQSWLAGERRGEAQRAHNALAAQRYAQNVNHEIVEHRRNTYSEIANDMYLNMTNQEEYVNPYTKEVETGTNQYSNRWQNGDGEVIYTNDPNYDPNRDPNIEKTDFKRSVARPR